MKILLKTSLIISFSGIFFLFFLSKTQQPQYILKYQELKLNEKVKTIGKITSIRDYGRLNIIKLDNNITLICNRCSFKINKTIEAEGIVTSYKNKLQIQTTKIKVKI